MNKINAIYSYENGWKFYYATNPELSSLQNLEGGRGYIVISSGNFELKLNGVAASVLKVPGWNLVAGTREGNASEAFGSFTVLYGFNKASNSYSVLNPNSYITKGEAYWVYI